jgi:hypothetical protein
MSLNTLLARPLSGTLLDEWKGSIKNLPIFKGTVIGSIRWLKTMDPLLTPKHADAFELRLTHTETYPSYEGGLHWVTMWLRTSRHRSGTAPTMTSITELPS